MSPRRAGRGRGERAAAAVAWAATLGACGSSASAARPTILVDVAPPPRSGAAPVASAPRPPEAPGEDARSLEPGLEVTDERVGDGRVARRGDRVEISYVALRENGDEVDSSYGAGETVTFQIGAGRVVAGIERGVIGMRVGGQRRMRVAPQLAFGERGHAYGVAPDSVVVFVVELLSIE